MELVLAALVTAFGSVIIALIARATGKAASVEKQALAAAEIAMESAELAHKKLATIEKQTATNGSNRTLGELAELMYIDLQATKRELAEHQRRTDAHGLQLWERRR